MKETEKTISHSFYLEPLPVDVNIIGYNNDKSFTRFLINEGVKLDEASHTNDVAYVHLRGNSVYLVFYLPNLNDIGTICHESIHIVDKALQAIGQPEHIINDDELVPYYTQFVCNQIIEFLQENKILSLTFNSNKNE